ncbi:uncharacterized protein VTP21DRAFT_11062 [Calcarisporiella thermophila]|uniref:uncharacterized protein n=1 Tax=Calcarisporiella thermophila TaxID=911321 RepID=UPI00374260AA
MQLRPRASITKKLPAITGLAKSQITDDLDLAGKDKIINTDAEPLPVEECSGNFISPVASKNDASVVKIHPKRKLGDIGPKSSSASIPPPDWLSTYTAIRDYRKTHIAPVDTMGCERLAEYGENIDPKVSRFQTLVSLMLSSQTKDTVTAEAMRNLQRKLPGGLSINSVLAASELDLQKLICKVGFSSRKSIFIKDAARICLEKYNGDIPDTLEGLCALPGVGPKMAHLTMQCAWNKTIGIGVDVHVHRICNRLGWCKTAGGLPEDTRKALEKWLPREYWREINAMLVGFGQTVCLPRYPRCSDCPVRDACPSAFKEAKKSKVK